MTKKSVLLCSALLVLGGSALATSPEAQATGFNPMNMMNPSKWFGGNRGRYDDDYYYDRYYYDGPYRRWGPGWGGYGPYGYGGWPGPGYGYGYGAPYYGANQPQSSTPPPPPRPE